MTDEKIKRHVFVANPKTNGGEQIFIVTEIHRHPDGEWWLSQSFDLESYGNSATIHLGNDVLTPEKLREMANELEKFLNLNT